MLNFSARLLAFAFALPAMIVVGGNAIAATVEEEVDRIEDARYEAMAQGDLARLGDMLADEFVYHQPTGRVATKASYIEQLRSGDLKLHEARRYDVKIRVYGNVAAAMGLTHLDIEQQGKRSQFELRYFNVWVMRDGRWQLAGRQSAFVPK